MTLTIMASPKGKTILVDLGGVFVHPPTDRTLATGNSTIPLRRLMLSSTWMEYECGKLSETDCFSRLASEYCFETSELAALMSDLRQTITYDEKVAAVFAEAKQPGTRIFLVTNISCEDYTALRGRWSEDFWSIFDGVFTSSALGVRKPNLGFYRHVLRVTRSIPHETFFVDDRPENVLAALSFGMKGTFEISDISRSLANFIGDPIQRGLAFLQRQQGKFPTTTQYGEPIDENYAPLLMREVLNDKHVYLYNPSDPSLTLINRSLVNVEVPSRLWNFFSGKPKYTTEDYPQDLDTTSLGMLAFPPEDATAHSILDDMLDHIDDDGSIQTYFDKSRPRADAVITLNVLTVFHKYGRSHELPTTLEWMVNILLNRAYIKGTRYYANAEWFLYYMVRLLRESTDATLQERIQSILRTRVAERIGSPGDAFCLGMRVLACKHLEIENYPDRQKLLDMQQEDGGWEASCLYYFPGKNLEVGNRGASTAFALKALECWAP
ncbi:HAD-like protein [Penicillium nucicola]|uniref:HAD-like protein n=1 Tax=Penicillium nucicola TaxID=1850975 RepID=UPI0025455227|nr:HAD-like protein [Penicillium nucicola]KAJ5762333.1 HAD-like protein [Penicillium nucicola]